MIINFQEVIFGGGSVRKKIFLVIYEIFVHDRVNIFLFEIFDFYESNFQKQSQKVTKKLEKKVAEKPGETKLESNEQTREESYGETKLENRE